MFHKKSLLLILISSFFFLGNTVFSITPLIPEDFMGNELNYTLSPELPKPNQAVRVKLESFNFNIDSSEIFYYINDELIRSGTGLKNFTFRAPASGEKMNLTIIAKDKDGRKHNQNIIIQPVSAILVYELLDGHKPIFYQGKAYPISNSSIKVRAFTDFFDREGNYIKPENLIYNWEVNRKFQQKNSGFGRQELIIPRLDAYPMETIIEVEITDLKNTNKIITAILLSPENSTVDFYVMPIAEPFRYKNILEGKTLFFNNLDTQILAVPWFMNGINQTTEPLNYIWRVNGRRVVKSIHSNQNLINIAVEENSPQKSAKISLRIENQLRPLQYFSSFFEIQFVENNIDRNLSQKESRKIFNRSGQTRIQETTAEKDGGFFGLF